MHYCIYANFRLNNLDHHYRWILTNMIYIAENVENIWQVNLIGTRAQTIASLHHHNNLTLAYVNFRVRSLCIIR